jgi:glycosyltransferase involved in cell wall biosynthesis
MRVSVSVEQRYQRTPDGSIWTSALFPYKFWLRYLEVFDEVQFLARVESVRSVPENYSRVDGPGVTCAPIPYYLGPWQFLQRYPQIEQAVWRYVASDDAVIMRVGSILAEMVTRRFIPDHRPYALEVVSDPADAFSPGAIVHPLRRLFRLVFYQQLRNQCHHATAVAYVTERALQKRYPVSGGSYQTNFSSVDLSSWPMRPIMTHFSDVEFPDRKQALRQPKIDGVFNLLFVGSLEQMYKAPDVLLKAAARCLAQGLSIHLTMIGGGCYEGEMRRLAQRLMISEHVAFIGQVSPAQVFREMERADVFVMPSRTEGLPRAMLEAMFVGLPCIGSNIGGIPELLAEEDLVPVNHRGALAQKIKEVIRDPQRRQRMSQRNREYVARHFHPEELRQRRVQFFKHIRAATNFYLAHSTSAHGFRGR